MSIAISRILFPMEGTPTEFSSTQLTCYGELQEEDFDSISEVLRYYYAARNAATRIRQRSSRPFDAL